jgi:hypothetical protein
MNSVDQRGSTGSSMRACFRSVGLAKSVEYARHSVIVLRTQATPWGILEQAAPMWPASWQEE